MNDGKTQKDDGGYAFPLTGDTPNYRDRADGMTLRDWFAGQALVGLHASSDGVYRSSSVAKLAYDQADAMIAERNKS